MLVTCTLCFTSFCFAGDDKTKTTIGTNQQTGGEAPGDAQNMQDIQARAAALKAQAAADAAARRAAAAKAAADAAAAKDKK